MDKISVNVNINLDALLGELQRALQWTNNLVALALRGELQFDDDSILRLPLDSFPKVYDQRLKWTPIEAIDHYKNWILSNGFRDVIEGTNSFIESAHNSVLSFWKLAKKQKDGIDLCGEDWNREIVSGEKSFNRLGLPDKFSHIEREHGITPDATLIRQVLSINSARNCLVLIYK